MLFVGPVPFFDGGSADSDRLAIRVCVREFCCLPEELTVADGGIRGTTFQWGDDGKTEKGNLLLPVECHEKSSFKRMVRWSRGIRGQPTR